MGLADKFSISDRFTFFLCPPELAQYLSCSATTVLVVGVGFDLLCFLGVPFFLFRYISTVDHAAHLGGFAIGILAGEMWKRDQLGARVGPWRVWNSNDGKGREKKWWERLLGR